VSPQPILPGVAGEVYFSMYSCFFLLPFACWMCTQADRKLDLIGVIETISFVLADIPKRSQIKLLHIVWCFVGFDFVKSYDLSVVIMKFLHC
jgi:hypothetical protein